MKSSKVSLGFSHWQTYHHLSAVIYRCPSCKPVGFFFLLFLSSSKGFLRRPNMKNQSFSLSTTLTFAPLTKASCVFWPRTIKTFQTDSTEFKTSHTLQKKIMSDCCTSRVEGEGKVEQRRWREGGGVSNVSGDRTLLQQKADAARIVLHSITGWPGYHLYTTWLGLYADRTSAGGGGGGAETTPRPEVEW